MNFLIIIYYSMILLFRKNYKVFLIFFFIHFLNSELCINCIFFFQHLHKFLTKKKLFLNEEIVETILEYFFKKLIMNI